MGWKTEVNHLKLTIYLTGIPFLTSIYFWDPTLREIYPNVMCNPPVTHRSVGNL